MMHIDIALLYFVYCTYHRDGVLLYTTVHFVLYTSQRLCPTVNNYTICSVHITEIVHYYYN